MSRSQKLVSLSAWAILLGLVAFQAWAFYYRLTLSLGPRVILQPWLQRQGFVIYEDLADIHMPLMPLVLQALVPLTGDELRLAKLVLVGLLAVTALLVFWFARRASGPWAGAWAAFFFVVWAPALNAGKLWHESFLTPATLLYLFFYRPNQPRRSLGWCAALGLVGGLNLLIKQHAAVIFAAYLLYELLTAWVVKRPLRQALRELAAAGAFAALPVLAYIIYQWISAGTLAGFTFWTVGYNFAGVYEDLSRKTITLEQAAALMSAALLLPAAILSLFTAGEEAQRCTEQRLDQRLHCGLWLALMTASFVLVYPRYASFHLLPALPLLALLSARGLSWALCLPGRGRRLGWAVGLALSLYWAVSAGGAYIHAVQRSQQREIVEFSSLEPVAQQLRAAVQPGQRFFIFMDDESLSNLYYLAGSPPPTFWIFHYPWYMIDRVRQRLLADLDANQPEWVVYSAARTDAAQYAPDLEAYIWQHYALDRPLAWDERDLLLLKRK